MFNNQIKIKVINFIIILVLLIGHEVHADMQLNGVATFSVTVPMVLPIDMDSNGNVYVSNNTKITNNGTGPVKVDNVVVNSVNGWNIANFNTDFTSEKVNTRRFGMRINGENVNTNGEVYTNWPDIPVGGSRSIDYDAVVSANTTNITKQKIADVVFMIRWADGFNPNPEPEVPKDTWDPNVSYVMGTKVIYNGRKYTPHWNNVKGYVPGLVGSPWQEITDEWRVFNIYSVNGVIVNYNGAQFKVMGYSKGVVPGTVESAVWFELTDQYRSFNVYKGGEIAWYNGTKYQAQWYTHGTPPPAQVWKVVN